MLNAAPNYIIDVEAVCRRVVADPRNARVSTVEQLAVCAFALEKISPTPAEPPLKASLAASLALAVAAWNVVQSGETEPENMLATLEFQQRFNTLKTQFEEEFPNG